MMLRAILVAAGLCAIVATLYLRLHAVHAYSLPAQRGTALPPASLILTIHEDPMEEEWAPILGGILPAEKGSEWSWTNAQARLRFRLEEADRWLFCLHFAAVGQVLKAVGPQRIEVLINGVSVKAIPAADAREYDVRFPVDPAVLKSGMNDVELRIAPAYIANDGVALGALLHSVGFLEQR
jgi:hypothetical protein